MFREGQKPDGLIEEKGKKKQKLKSN